MQFIKYGLVFLAALLSMGISTHRAKAAAWSVMLNTSINCSNQYSITFVDSVTGFIVGSKSPQGTPGFTILKTADGGKSWQPGIIDESGSGNINQLCFVDTGTGYAYHRTFLNSTILDYSILKTTDGGNTWYHLSPAASINYIGMNFFSSENGLIVTCTGLVFETADGGISWQQRNDAPIPLETEDIIVAAAFAAPETGYITTFNGYVLKTTDGGITWNQIHKIGRTPAVSMSVVSSQKGFILGRDAVYRTLDGGATWQESPLYTEVSQYDIHFINQNTGFVGGKGYIFKTDNGGNSWKYFRTELSFPFKRFAFRDEQTGFAVGESNLLMKTENGGNSWGVDKFHVKLSSIKSLDGKMTYAIGEGYFVSRGENMYNVNFPGITAFDIWVHSPEKIIAVGYVVSLYGKPAGNPWPWSRILMTNDGGVTWKDVAPHEMGETLYSLHFPIPDVGYAVGTTAVMKTTDGGDTWETVYNGWDHSIQFNSVFFVSPVTGWIAGNSGRILKTTDGGYNWSSRESNTDANLRKIFFADAKVGYAVGDGGVAVKTNNGGETWSVMVTGTDVNLLAVHALAWNYVFVAGENGVMLRTRDGGKTWVREETHTTNTLRSIHFSPQNVGFAAGDNIILKTAGSVSVQEPEQAPRAITIHNSPNPFNPSTTISYTIPAAGPAELTVYSITGQKVRTLLSQRMEAGVHSAAWDGRDDSGNTVSSGVYIARMRAGKTVSSHKMLLMK